MDIDYVHISDKIRTNWLLSFIFLLTCIAVYFFNSCFESGNNFSTLDYEGLSRPLVALISYYFFSFRLKGTGWLLAALFFLPAVMLYIICHNFNDFSTLSQLVVFLLGGWHWINCYKLFKFNRKKQRLMFSALQPSLLKVSKYVICKWNMKGRASLREFWSFRLVFFIFLSIIYVLQSKALLVIFSLIAYPPDFFLGIRRLHDTNHSAWWFVLPFILNIFFFLFLFFLMTSGITSLFLIVPLFACFICWAPPIYFVIKKGDAHPNRFGPSTTDQKKISDHFQSMKKGRSTKS